MEFFGDSPVVSCPEFSNEPALAAEHGGSDLYVCGLRVSIFFFFFCLVVGKKRIAQGHTNLGTSGLSQILLAHKVHLPPQMVIGMDHFVGQGILQVAAGADRVAANQDAVVGVKAAALAGDAAVGGEASGAAAADNVGGVHFAAVVELGDAVVEEEDGGRKGQEPVAEALGAGDVARFVDAVALFAVVEYAFVCHVAG